MLSAAGRIFGQCAGADLDFFEGGYGHLLLKTDVASPPVALGWQGRMRPRRSAQVPGLGVEVNEDALKGYAGPCWTLP